MKTKLLIAVICAGLAFASCKKDEMQRTEDQEVSGDIINVNGKNYNINDLIAGLSTILKVSTDKIYYDHEEKVFRYRGFSNPYYAEAVVELTASLSKN